jgi:hypothetical protein
MSTKDISRSALEGGRHNQDDRNESHRRERSRLRTWLAHNGHEDGADASDPEERPYVEKGFTDKLKPCYRWLASRAGERWDDVYSELRSKFDTRTLASWHIVIQHMLREVDRTGTGVNAEFETRWYRYQRFYVDGEGLLRDRGWYWTRFPSRSAPRITRNDREAVMKKSAGRAIVDYGVSQFWLDPVGERWETCARPSKCSAYCAEKDHRVVDQTPLGTVTAYTESENLRAFRDSPHWRKYVAQHPVNTGWRQGKRLTAEEVVWWKGLRPELKELLARKPANH